MPRDQCQSSQKQANPKEQDTDVSKYKEMKMFQSHKARGQTLVAWTHIIWTDILHGRDINPRYNFKVGNIALEALLIS